MRLNIFNSILSIILSLLICYGLVHIPSSQDPFLLKILGFIVITITLLPIMALDFKNLRKGLNLKVLASVFFVVSLLVNLGYILLPVPQQLYVLLLGLSSVIYLFCFRFIYKD